jgi:putative flippase GtrA
VNTSLTECTVESVRLLQGQGRPLGPLRILGQEFVRALCVGLIATALDMGVLGFLVSGLGWGYLIANACSFGVGTLANYALSVSWVFRSRTLRDWRVELLVFAGAGILGLGVSQAAMFVCVELIGLYYFLAKVVATGCHFVFNFTSRKLLLFRTVR